MDVYSTCECRWHTEWWFCHESRWIRQQLCTFIPVNGLQSIMQLRISNHRVITEHEGGGRCMIIDVNVEIINKIAGNALGGLSYWTSCRTIWEDWSVKSSLLPRKSCAHHPRCSGEHLRHDGEDENSRTMSVFESQWSVGVFCVIFSLCSNFIVQCLNVEFYTFVPVKNL